jgi:hypothetical protein
LSIKSIFNIALLQVWDLGNLLEAAAVASGPEGSEAVKRSKKAKGNDQQVIKVCLSPVPRPILLAFALATSFIVGSTGHHFY